MEPVHWALLVLFVCVLGFLGLKGGFPTSPQMPAVKNPDAVRPAPKVLTPPVESSASAVGDPNATTTSEAAEGLAAPSQESLPVLTDPAQK